MYEFDVNSNVCCIYIKIANIYKRWLTIDFINIGSGLLFYPCQYVHRDIYSQLSVIWSLHLYRREERKQITNLIISFIFSVKSPSRFSDDLHLTMVNITAKLHISIRVSDKLISCFLYLVECKEYSWQVTVNLFNWSSLNWSDRRERGGWGFYVKHHFLS